MPRLIAAGDSEGYSRRRRRRPISPGEGRGANGERQAIPCAACYSQHDRLATYSRRAARRVPEAFPDGPPKLGTGRRTASPKHYSVTSVLRSVGLQSAAWERPGDRRRDGRKRWGSHRHGAHLAPLPIWPFCEGLPKSRAIRLRAASPSSAPRPNRYSVGCVRTETGRSSGAPAETSAARDAMTYRLPRTSEEVVWHGRTRGIPSEPGDSLVAFACSQLDMPDPQGLARADPRTRDGSVCRFAGVSRIFASPRARVVLGSWVMQTIALQKWAVDNEPDLTREVYAQIECGGAEDCGCEACFNFATTRHLVYSAELLEFLDWLGIDPQLEAWARHEARLASGPHRYTVSFYLVGRIARGPSTPVACRAAQLRIARAAGDVEVGFCADASDAPEAFAACRACDSRCASWRRGCERPRAARAQLIAVAPHRARDRSAPAAVSRERPRRVRAHHGRRGDDALPRARGAVDREQAWRSLGYLLAHWQIRGFGLWAAEESQRRARRPDRPVAGRRLARHRAGMALARERWGNGPRPKAVAPHRSIAFPALVRAA